MRIFFCILIISFYISSCDSFLDENPDNRKELETVEDVAKLVANSYNQGTYLFVEWMTDNSTAIADNAQADYMTEAFLWLPVVSYESQESPTYFWNNAYYCIAHCNEALAVIDQVKGNDDLRSAIKGEALISRAYNHFLLVNVFSKHYFSDTAGNNPGIPYVVEVESNLFKNYKRGTISDVYDSIEKDLILGLSLLKDDYFVGTKKYHFTKKAAYAFASRFYLFKKDYLKSLHFCNLVLDDKSEYYVRDLDKIYQGLTFDEMSANYSDVRETANLLAIRKESFYARANFGYRSNEEVFNDIFLGNVQNEIDSRDQRWNFNTSSVFAPKFNEQFKYTTSNTGFPYFIQNELKGEEVILNRAECYIMLAEYQKALDDYHTLAAGRYENGGILDIEKIKNYYNISDTKNAMLQFLLDERRKEFLDEGIRWFDIKRFELSVTHVDLNGNTYHLTPNDGRTAVQLPQSAIANGLKPNSR